MREGLYDLVAGDSPRPGWRKFPPCPHAVWPHCRPPQHRHYTSLLRSALCPHRKESWPRSACPAGQRLEAGELYCYMSLVIGRERTHSFSANQPEEPRAWNKQGSAIVRDTAPSPRAGKVPEISCSAKGVTWISDT